MRPFKYSRTTDTAAAVATLSGNPKAQLLAGGTNILDLMKEDVERPDELVDISHLLNANAAPVAMNLAKTAVIINGFGKNTATANHTLIKQNFPVLSQAILAGASQQIRNMASNGGNLNQRTRCPYFYEVSMPCNKREPGTGCGALQGVNRMHAIFGWSEQCVAVHPSDMCVALAALDATVNVQGLNGKKRSIPFIDYHRLPGDNPQKDNTLEHGELVTSISVPLNNFSNHSYYLKVRDRASYAFALVSVAALLELDGNTIRKVSIALGGVAHKPWRAFAAENFLAGKAATEANFKAAAALEMQSAKPLGENEFKVELGSRAITRALMQAAHI